MTYVDDSGKTQQFGSAGGGGYNAFFGYDTNNGAPSQNRDVLTQETREITGVGEGISSYSNLFSYDRAYNTTQYGAASLLFNNDNQLATGDFGNDFEFDSQGDPTTYQNTTFSFDPADRLAYIASPAFSASYDGAGLRATRTCNGTTTYYLYSGSSPIIEETYTGTTPTVNVTAVYGYTADGLRSVFVPASGSIQANYYDYLYDPQGNAIQSADPLSFDAGSWIDNVKLYSAYGVPAGTWSTVPNGTPAMTPPTSVGYGGQYGYYTDPTGLMLLTNRYYDSGAGRFLNRDPSDYRGGMNLYAFCDGNPINESDPTGLSPSVWARIVHWLCGGGIDTSKQPVMGCSRGDEGWGAAYGDDTSGVPEIYTNPQAAAATLHQGVNNAYQMGASMVPIPGAGEAEAAEEVIVDTNAVYNWSQAKNYLKPGQVPVITRTILAELRQNAVRGKMRMPGYVGTFKVIDDSVNIDLAMDLRQAIRDISGGVLKPGLNGDGRIGSTGITTGTPILTYDKIFTKALEDAGVDCGLLPKNETLS